MNSKNNLSKFENVYEDMVFTRLEHMDIKIFETDEINRIKNEVDDIYKMIKKFLPCEHRKLIDKYEDTRTYQQALLDNIIYEQGLKDGVKLKELLES